MSRGWWKSGSDDWFTLARSVREEFGNTGAAGVVDEGCLLSKTVDAREELLLFRSRWSIDHFGWLLEREALVLNGMLEDGSQLQCVEIP